MHDRGQISADCGRQAAEELVDEDHHREIFRLDMQKNLQTTYLSGLKIF